MDTLNYSQLMNLPNYFDYSKIIKINISSCDLKSLYRLNLGKFNNLEILYCDDNRLKSIDDISNCTSLQVLHCDGNQLSNLDGLSNCTSLKVLNCSYNQLENLDGLINCTSLQELYCQNNQLENLNCLSNFISLQILYCNNNKLENLDHLNNCTSLQKIHCHKNNLSNLNSFTNCISLQELWCWNNRLKNLDGLSNCVSLQILYCGCNQLENIDCITNCTFLRKLFCNSNKLTTLFPIKNLRNLRKIRYYDNPLEGPHHPAVLRIIKRNKKIIIYSDRKNDHDLKINKSVNTSIINLVKVHGNSIKSKGKIINKLLDLKFPRIENLLFYFQNEDVHSYFNMTYFEMFQLIFAEIERLNYDSEILKCLHSELNNYVCECFTARFIGTIKCLNSFSEHVNIENSDNSQIDTIMLLIKNDFENNKIKKEELLDTVKSRFKMYNTKEETIEFIQCIFSEMYLE